MLLRPFCTLLLKKAGGGGGGGGGPTVCTADLDLYVRADGNDANDGLANTAARAFKTIGAAVKKIQAAYNLAGYTAKVTVADGTYNEAVVVQQVPNGRVHFSGSASAIWRGNGGTALAVWGSRVAVTGFTFDGATTDNAIMSLAGSEVSMMGGHVFAAVNQYHLVASRGGTIILAGAYSITGGGFAHYGAFENGTFYVGANFTVTITNTSAFTCFIFAGRGGAFACSDFSGYGFSGYPSGKRFEAFGGGVIYISNNASKGTGFFPGNTAGTISTGGVYSS